MERFFVLSNAKDSLVKLHSIISVADDGNGSLLVEADITDIAGERYAAEHCLTPGDEFGLSPEIRQAVEEWIDAGNAPTPYAPPPEPTPEELRAAMPPLSMRQLRLGLRANGIALASVQAAVDAISDPAAREVAQIEWEYSDKVERTHSLISQIGTALNLTPEQIDTMWEDATAL